MWGLQLITEAWLFLPLWFSCSVVLRLAECWRLASSPYSSWKDLRALDRVAAELFSTRKHDCPILLWIQTSIAEPVLKFMTKDKCQMRLYFFSNRAQNIPECRRLQQQMVLHKLTSNGHSFRSKPCSVRYLLSVQNGRDLRHPQVHNSSTALAGNNMTINKETWSTLIDILSPTQSKIGQQPTNRDKIRTSNMFARSRNPAA